MIVPLEHVMTVSFLLFLIGLTGLFTRKDALTVFLSIELILNSANIILLGEIHNNPIVHWLTLEISKSLNIKNNLITNIFI